MKPIVAVVGRPNVGKSTLVNRLAQTSDAIVHESRGVTRDRSYHTADWNGREFTIVDTGGIEPLKSDESVARMLKRCDKPVFLLVNKLDNPDRENDSIWEFYSLGIGEPTPLSALHGHGTGDLLDAVVEDLRSGNVQLYSLLTGTEDTIVAVQPHPGRRPFYRVQHCRHDARRHRHCRRA